MHGRIDVLVVAPLDEEYLISASILGAGPDAPLPSEYELAAILTPRSPRMPFYKFNVMNKTIGIQCIGGAGNLLAYTMTKPVIDAFKPKVVLLVGIAAGNSPKRELGGDPSRPLRVNVGDVIYNGDIIYTGLGKAWRPSTDDIDSLLKSGKVQISQDEKGQLERLWKNGFHLDVRPPRHSIGDVPRLARCSEIVANSEKWAEDAKALFYSIVASNSPFLHSQRVWQPSAGHRWPADEYPLRYWDKDSRDIANRVPVAHHVHIASGELVLASGIMQTLIRLRCLRDDIKRPISGFEMEAHAVKSVCDEWGIPFLTIRGVSDRGEGDKDVASDKDRDHLAATCVAASFTRRLIELREFRDALDEIGDPRRANSVRTDVDACIDMSVISGCPHRYGECIDGVHVPVKPLQLVRVYEEVDFAMYSGAISSFIASARRENEWWHVLLLYPYTAEETMQICRRELRAKAVKKDAWERWMQDKSSDIRSRFSHFDALEEYARDAAEHNAIVQRLIIANIAPYGKARARDLAVYSNFLSANKGSNIQTWIVSPNAYRGMHRGLVSDDVVLVDKVVGSNPRQLLGGDMWPKALRYFSKSELFVQRGWRCEHAGGLSGEMLERNDGLTKTIRFWREWREREWPVDRVELRAHAS